MACAASAEPDMHFSRLRETRSHVSCSQHRGGRSIALHHSSCPRPAHHQPRPREWHFQLTTTLFDIIDSQTWSFFFKAQPITEVVILRGWQCKWPYTGRGTLGDYECLLQQFYELLQFLLEKLKLQTKPISSCTRTVLINAALLIAVKQQPHLAEQSGEQG